MIGLKPTFLPPLLLIAALLGACSQRDAIELEVRDLIEADHWSRGEQRICTVRYKLLNNTEHDLNKLSASFVWRDEYGDEIESLMIMDSPLPSDQATRTASTEAMYGGCADIEMVGIRNVLRCEIDGLTREECIRKLTIIYRDGVEPVIAAD